MQCKRGDSGHVLQRSGYNLGSRCRRRLQRLSGSALTRTSVLERGRCFCGRQLLRVGPRVRDCGVFVRAIRDGDLSHQQQHGLLGSHGPARWPVGSRRRCVPSFGEKTRDFGLPMADLLLLLPIHLCSASALPLPLLPLSLLCLFSFLFLHTGEGFAPGSQGFSPQWYELPISPAQQRRSEANNASPGMHPQERAAAKNLPWCSP